MRKKINAIETMVMKNIKPWVSAAFVTALSVGALSTARADNTQVAAADVIEAGTKGRAALHQQVDSTIVPDRFLRRWDPVTIFFPAGTGKAEGGPEDYPEKYVTMEPNHPGAYRWLDDRTLQFKPAEAWAPLKRVQFSFAGKKQQLDTLMAAPLKTKPSNGDTEQVAVETVTLEFPEPLAAKALRQMLSIELRELPGVDGSDSRWLDKDDFELKTLERRNRSDRGRYVVKFNNPLPSGVRALLHFKLSLNDSSPKSFSTVSFATAKPFRLTRMGCNWSFYPVTPKGVTYTREQAMRCSDSNREISLDFSHQPQDLSALEARNLVRLTPAVDDLEYTVSGSMLRVSGKFKSEIVYKMALQPTKLKDNRGRDLDMSGDSAMYMYFPPRADYLKWSSGRAFSEQFGPKMVPVEGRGFQRVDLRVHAIDPMNRSFWPFPSGSVTVQEQSRPPGPGETVAAFTEPRRNIRRSGLTKQLKQLGSPNVSSIIDLPLQAGGSSAKFGIDLAPHLARIHGKQAPGHYLVGVRRLDASTHRDWMRVQVTDLDLATVEERNKVKFFVTSLATGQPVSNATVKIEGTYRTNQDTTWATMYEGTTDSSGALVWNVMSQSNRINFQIQRISVKNGADSLVLDPSNPPDRFRNGYWQSGRGSWLSWTTERYVSNRLVKKHVACHLFTERPIYRPDEPVHIKGYLRNITAGHITNVANVTEVLKVVGPGGENWEYKLTTNEHGAFYHKFAEQKLPTGDFVAHWRNRTCSVSFKKEAYRVPRFEVTMNGPKKAALDKPFKVGLLAEYYAGGEVAEQKVSWRATEFPYNWSPKGRKGFRFSSDARYSRSSRFRTNTPISESGKTDEHGAATLTIDPTSSRSASPRRYVVEATVLGADDQTVSATHEVVALPPFVLGIKAPRYLPEAKTINPEFLVLDYQGKALKDKKVKLTMYRREWHSHLQAGDFSKGAAKYVTEVVDNKLLEKDLVSAADAMKLSLPIQRAGVYVIELEAQDELGRSQVVQIDLFAGGKESVSWERPVDKSFKMTADKKTYQPGETAKLVLQSPYQNGRALVIIETPDGNDYRWLDVVKGKAVTDVVMNRHYMPYIPVHAMLIRGRVANSSPMPAGMMDLGKPAMLAASYNLKVSTDHHRVNVNLDYAEKAQPGDEFKIKIKLRDHADKPVSGEVTLWMVDQAVLALGREQPLDPMSAFVKSRRSFITIRDNRNRIVGFLPYREQPGGDVATRAKAKDLLDNVTVRKNFKTVPYYNPSILVGESGETELTFQLPDNLTNFKLRAKAVSGPDRFGFAKGHLEVRLPVIVQPALPRFVRSGDTFVASAIGRIVEGDGGAGIAVMRADGLTMNGKAERVINWDKKLPQRIDFPVTVEGQRYNDDGSVSHSEVSVKVAVKRDADGGKDAFSVNLPLLPDRSPEIIRRVAELKPGGELEIEALPHEARNGTLRRSVLVSNQPALVKMASGLNYLLEYPHGCTEQQISTARGLIAIQRMALELPGLPNADALHKRVQKVMKAIDNRIASNNLVAYWPGSRGYVSLTAWAVDFMSEAKAAELPINEATYASLIRGLKNSLRSDYTFYVSGASYAERVWALQALARAGHVDRGYAEELARKAQFLNLESLAQVHYVLARYTDYPQSTSAEMSKRIWNGLVTELYQGKEKYRGLQDGAISRYAAILPSESRTVAEVTRSLVASSKNPRSQILVDALVNLGQKDGWGSTQANASAMFALSEVLETGTGATETHVLHSSVASQSKTEFTLSDQQAVHNIMFTTGKAVTLQSATADASKPLLVRSETRYVPIQDGSLVKARAQGLVIDREHQKVNGDGKPMDKTPLSAAGLNLQYQIGDVVEEHVSVVNPTDRTFVAIVVPLAAGMEPMNPNLATSSEEAKPAGRLTQEPTYVAFMDDHVAYYYNDLPKGSYHFYFRTRATVPGRFVQPSAYAEMMYNEANRGRSNGAVVSIERPAP